MPTRCGLLFVGTERRTVGFRTEILSVTGRRAGRARIVRPRGDEAPRPVPSPPSPWPPSSVAGAGCGKTGEPADVTGGRVPDRRQQGRGEGGRLRARLPGLRHQEHHPHGRRRPGRRRGRRRARGLPRGHARRPGRAPSRWSTATTGARALAAAVLMADPIRAPVLLTDGEEMPERDARPRSTRWPRPARSPPAARRSSASATSRGPRGLKTTDLVGKDPATLARAIDAFHAAARGASSDSVLRRQRRRARVRHARRRLGGQERRPDPVRRPRRRCPADQAPAIAAHQQPRIYVLGPSTVISPKVTVAAAQARARSSASAARTRRPTRSSSRKLPRRRRSAGASSTPATAWCSPIRAGPPTPPRPRRCRPAARGARCCCSATTASCPRSVEDYLLDIQPGYRDDPTRGVYNHGWIIGDDTAISVAAQARIDALLEIAPAKNSLPSQP